MNENTTADLISPIEKIKQFIDKHGKRLLGVSKMLISFVGGQKQIDIIDNDIIGSDLFVSDLRTNSRIKPLSGYETFNITEYGNVYPEGCRLSFTIGHNNIGKDQIIINGLYINVLDFIEGKSEEISCKRSTKKIIGAGVIKPYKFIVQLAGNHIANLQWTFMPDVPGNITVLSDNLFDTDPPQKLSFEKSEDTIELEGVIRANKTGLYFVNLSFEYCIVGKGDYCFNTGVIYIYKE